VLVAVPVNLAVTVAVAQPVLVTVPFAVSVTVCELVPVPVPLPVPLPVFVPVFVTVLVFVFVTVSVIVPVLASARGGRVDRVASSPRTAFHESVAVLVAVPVVASDATARTWPTAVGGADGSTRVVVPPVALAWRDRDPDVDPFSLSPDVPNPDSSSVAKSDSVVRLTVASGCPRNTY